MLITKTSKHRLMRIDLKRGAWESGALLVHLALSICCHWPLEVMVRGEVSRRGYIWYIRGCVIGYIKGCVRGGGDRVCNR